VALVDRRWRVGAFRGRCAHAARGGGFADQNRPPAKHTCVPPTVDGRLAPPRATLPSGVSVRGAPPNGAPSQPPLIRWKIQQTEGCGGCGRGGAPRRWRCACEPAWAVIEVCSPQKRPRRGRRCSPRNCPANSTLARPTARGALVQSLASPQYTLDPLYASPWLPLSHLRAPPSSALPALRQRFAAAASLPAPRSPPLLPLARRP